MEKNDRPGRRALRGGRCSQENGIYFLTTVTEDRIPWFQVFSFARLVCHTINQPNAFRDAKPLCWVVMPDHIHLLLQLDKTSLNKVVAQFKSRSARLLNREIGRSGRFWEDGFHDHALRREETLLDVARYIVANPLRAGLARRYGDYPYWDAVWV